jgi:hypothetical protein
LCRADYLFTPHTFHRFMKERKPVAYKTSKDNTYTQTVHNKIMESTYSWHHDRNNKSPYTLQQLKYSLQRCPGFMQSCPMLHLTISIQTQICDCSVCSNCFQVNTILRLKLHKPLVRLKMYQRSSYYNRKNIYN